MKKYGFGVDIGGTTIKMSLFEMTGHMLDITPSLLLRLWLST